MKLLTQTGKYRTIQIADLDKMRGLKIDGERPTEVAFTADELIALSNRSVALFNIARVLQSNAYGVADIPTIASHKDIDL